jgi:hypothetical protein
MTQPKIVRGQPPGTATAPKAKSPAVSPPAQTTPASTGSPTAGAKEPGSANSFLTPRYAVVGKEAGLVALRYTKARDAFAYGVKTEYGLDSLLGKAGDAAKAATAVPEGAKALPEIAGLSSRQVAELFDVAKEIAGAKAARYAGFSHNAGRAALRCNADVRDFALTTLARDSVPRGAKAVEGNWVLRERIAQDLTRATGTAPSAEAVSKATSTVIDGMAQSDKAGEFVANALKGSKAAKALQGPVGKSLSGLISVWDLYREYQVETDPKSTTRQKWAARICLAGDVAMFAPWPPLQLAGAAVEFVAAPYRDSTHPLQDLKEFAAGKLQAAAGAAAATLSSPSGSGQ